MATKSFNVTNTNTKTGKQAAKGSSANKTFHPNAVPVVVKPVSAPATTTQKVREGITAKDKRETKAGLKK